MTTTATITVNSLHAGKKLKITQRYRGPGAPDFATDSGSISEVGGSLSVVVHDGNELQLNEVDADEPKEG